jgi:general secretion pathway protein C
MNLSSSFAANFGRQTLPGLLQGLAALALAAGVGVWASVVLAPAPGPQPPVLASSLAPRLDTSAITGWFGGGNARVRVTLAGLIASDAQGAALLSVDGGKPQAFRAGQAVAPGVTLLRVTPTQVEVDMEGATETLRPPANPNNVIQGFVPVR